MIILVVCSWENGDWVYKWFMRYRTLQGAMGKKKSVQ